MIVSRSHPRSLDALKALVVRATDGAKSVVVQAGHFLVYYDTVEDVLLPCVAEELTSPRHEILRREAGRFPLLTWQMGLELLASVAAPERRVMVVVNDWQYVPKDVDRRRFYSGYEHLPAVYEQQLAVRGAGTQLLTPPASAGTHPFFGEMNLRNQYGKRVEKLIREGRLPPGATTEIANGATVCLLSDAVGRHREVYCSNKTGDCAAEVAMMLQIARERCNCDCFVSLYPAVCRDFVESGTELGAALLGTGIPSVLNIGFPSSHVDDASQLIADCEASLHRFGARDEQAATARVRT